MIDLTLWMGTVAQGSFDERLAAAAGCGYSSISLAPADCDVSPRDLRLRADDAGIRLIALDPVVSWLPASTVQPEGPVDQRRRALIDSMTCFDVDRVLNVAATLGCASVSVIEPYGIPVPVELGAEAFASACDRAADHGIVVQLEAMPFSGVPDLITARTIVELAGRDNGGLVLDTWHLFRSGADASLIASLPVDRMSVQLSDAPARPETDLWAEALDRRLLPCDGALDLAGVMDALHARGFAGPIGPEVISAKLRTLTPIDAACRAARASRRLLEPLYHRR